jgi:hypothetical protein
MRTGMLPVCKTWRLGTDDLYIDNYHIFFQGNSTKINTRGQVMGGVCIILSPSFNQAHKKNRREVIKLDTGEYFEGRIIGVPLTFPNVDNNGKKSKENWTSHYAQYTTQLTT